ncbi:MAG: translation initiation factor IF-2 [Candidatus Absconditabacterales bacterium]
MPKIIEALEIVGIDEKQFGKLYKEVTGKTLTSKTSTVSEKHLNEIKEKLNTEKKGDTKKESKVLKSDELFQGAGGFLSGLGFEKKEKKIEKIEEDENTKETMILEKPRHAPIVFDTPQPKKEIKREENKTPFFKKAPPQRGDVKSRPSFQGGKGPYQNKSNYQKPYNNFQNNKPQYQQAKPTITIAPKIRKEAGISSNLVKKQEIEIEGKITVKEFSEKMGIPLSELMKKLIQNKIMTSITASLDFETASLIGEEFGIIVKKKENKLGVESFMSGDLQAILDLDKESENLLPRSPIVTIMGHVDHGKTSLLDYLRKTSIAEGEAGGITQSIGASVLEHEGKKICFIDTPGHELFTNLRSRGAKLTNIAVIVIAADDSVMPQTVESIGHAKAAGVPIIIAITKIDKPGKNIDQIKTDMAKHGLTPEDRGGDVPVIGISSKTGKGIPDLLETILIQAELLNLKYNPDRSAVGVVLDAHKDPKQGVISTIIVMTGTLKVGDIILAYNTYGKVKRMQNWKGQNINKATGGEPVQILGISDLPEPGRIVEVVKNEKEAQNKTALIQDQIKKQSPDSAVQQFISQLKSGAKESELRLILKSDGSSSLEALKQAVDGIQLPKNVTVKVIHSDVGHFSDSDLSLAQASSALLMGFNISLNTILKKKAESMKIEMKNFDIIYELTDYLDKLLKGMIEIEKHEVVIGKLEVLAIFFRKAKDMTIGGKVIRGRIKSKIKFRVIKGEEILGNGELVSLHRNKDEVKEVGEGEECGLKIICGKKIEIGDIFEFFEMQDIIE